MKDILWLERNLEYVIAWWENKGGSDAEIRVESYREILGLIRELEIQPLTEKWIDGNSSLTTDENEEEDWTVKAEKLRKVFIFNEEGYEQYLVDKAIKSGELINHGEEYYVTKKPLIPQYVADYIEGKRVLNLYGGFQKLYNEENRDVYSWVFRESNLDEFIIAWQFGYEVEVNKFIIKDSSENILLMKRDNGEVVPYDSEEVKNDDSITIELTEEEVRSVDGRYWLFHEQVKEGNE